MQEQAFFAAGCFWDVELAFRDRPGVVSTEIGYANGKAENPSYEDVCTGRTGHAETVHVTFDPEIISFDALLATFWTCHNPTQINRQGPDLGTQFRSAIFVTSDEQKQAAEASRIEQQESCPVYLIATVIEPLDRFWRAEDQHQPVSDGHSMAAE
ncbi:MAG: peptide-methionine (S)-S-oxide reductase MsrA [Magnetovibrionaceae bacterium]